jgi:hypothetical protein
MLDRKVIATELYQKIEGLFPEFQPFLSEDFEENPTMTLIDLVNSLQNANADPNEAGLLERLDHFGNG